jgi:hypothetical protein
MSSAPSPIPPDDPKRSLTNRGRRLSRAQRDPDTSRVPLLSRSTQECVATGDFSAIQFAGGSLLAHIIQHPDTPGKVLHR